MDGCPYDAEQAARCKGCPGDCWDEVTLRTEQASHPIVLPLTVMTPEQEEADAVLEW
jgi:hypothetical protein